jgi:hypothetical protein
MLLRTPSVILNIFGSKNNACELAMQCWLILFGGIASLSSLKIYTAWLGSYYHKSCCVWWDFPQIHAVSSKFLSRSWLRVFELHVSTPWTSRSPSSARLCVWPLSLCTSLSKCHVIKGKAHPIPTPPPQAQHSPSPISTLFSSALIHMAYYIIKYVLRTHSFENGFISINCVKGFHRDVYNVHIMYFDQIHPVYITLS